MLFETIWIHLTIYRPGSNLGTGGIDITPSLERQPPTMPPKRPPQASDIATPPLLTSNEFVGKTNIMPPNTFHREAVDVLNCETERALLPRETGEDIGFASPIPLSAEAVKIIMALRNMKDGDEDWGRWR
jgi:tRNA pseudouridine synthase 9